MGAVADELSERSKRDDAVIVGSEIRAALSELDSEGRIYRDALEAIVRPDNGMENGGITCRAIANLALVAVSGKRDE
jgi:hypothetical protein